MFENFKNSAGDGIDKRVDRRGPVGGIMWSIPTDNEITSTHLTLIALCLTSRLSEMFQITSFDDLRDKNSLEEEISGPILYHITNIVYNVILLIWISDT